VTDGPAFGFFAGITNISSIQAPGVNGIPLYAGYYAKVTGVATVASGIFSSSNIDVYIQDATQGVDIFRFGLTPSITAGNSYTVAGVINNFSGKTELVPDNGGDIIDNGASTIGFHPVTLTNLLATPESYDGVYLSVQHLTKVSGTWPTPGNAASLVYTDGTNNLTVFLASSTDMSSYSEPTGTLDIAGIFSQYDATPSYELMPRYFIYDFAADGALPVELSSFTSNINGRNVSLIWETKTEKNSDKFVIERQTIGTSWASIGSVKASVLSNSPKQYSFSDKNLNAGKYQYRLKMIDNDGTIKYSTVTEAAVSLPVNFDLSQNYPNPFNPSTKINYNLPSDSKVTLDIYNILGVKVGQLVNQDQSAGYYSVEFSTSSFNKSISSGVYLYKITAVDKATGNNFSAIKKMIMLK
jgi:hypothetical protein